MDNIYLKCSLYPNEIEVEMFGDNPIFKAMNIRDDVIVFEDACYEGRIELEKETKTIEEISVLLNEKLIGEVKFETNNEKVEGKIQFKEQVKGIAQPFLLQCDLISLGLRITYEDGGARYLYSQYLLCVSKSEEDTKNTENMLKELLLYDEDRVNSWIFGNKETNNIQDGLIEGSMRSKSYKSVITYIQLIEQIVGCYKEYYLYFKSSSKRNVIPVKDTIDYNKIRRFEQKDFNWLIKNMEKLSPVDINTSIEFGEVNYLPLKVMTEKRKSNFNVYENQVVLSFLKTIVDEAQLISIELHRAIATEENIYNKLRRVPIEGYYAPIITVKQIQNKYMRSIRESLEKIIMELRKIYQMYYKILPIDYSKLSVIPKRTKAFQEIRAYSRIYDMIIKWFEFGEVNLEKEKIIFRVKTIDKLYEYYCLQQILKMLSEEGFLIQDINEDIDFFRYEIDDERYKNELDIANTYILHKDRETVTLYYQPVIFSDGYSNELNLYRTTKKNLYYTPDFVLKFADNEKEKYVIFDSKYANRNSIVQYRLRECIWNYGVEIEPCKDNAEFRMMWLLQGRIDDSRLTYVLNNSPNSRQCRRTKSYGVISVNTKVNSRQKLWNEISKMI